MRQLLLTALSFLFLCAGQTCALPGDSTTTDSRFLAFLKGPPDSPFKLSLAVDLPLAGSSIALLALSNFTSARYKSYDATDLPSFKPEDVNSFDRWAIGPKDHGLQKLSDATNVLVGNYMWILLAGERSRKDFVKILAMYAHINLLYPLTIRYSQPFAARKRPYVYSSREPDRLDGVAQNSFLSGHTSWSFATAVLTGTLFHSYYPDSPWRFAVWGLCVGTASVEGGLRVAGHWHFPTDVLAGAAAGSLIGWFVPFLHRRRDDRRVSVAPLLGETNGVVVGVNIPDRRVMYFPE